MIKPIFFQSHPMTKRQNLPHVSCKVPFRRLYVQEMGNLYHCCTHWMPFSVGNILNTTISEYFKSNTWNTVEESFLDGSFNLCNADMCPSLQTMKATGKISGDLIERGAVEGIKNERLLEITLNYDRSCNLACPSCRSGLELIKHDAELDEIHVKTKQSIIELLDEGYLVDIAITSAGDPFTSLRYLDFLKNFHHDSGNYRFVINTNGTLMNQQRLDYPNIRERATGFSISIDAATAQTYGYVRRLGDFDQLMKNLKNLNERKGEGFFTQDALVTTNFVISAANYRELPQFVEMMLEFEHFTGIWLNLIADWGHLPNFKDYAIWDSSHHEHDNFLKVMRHPILKHEKLVASNASRFIY